MKHPAKERIERYALGLSDWTERVLIEAHLAFCPECEKKVAQLRQSVFEGFSQSNLPPSYSDDLLSSITQKLESKQTPVEKRTSEEKLSDIEKVIPDSVRAELPREEEWDWKTMWPTKGRIAVIKEDPTTGISLYCAQFQAGETAPAHKHLVQEDTVMLQGGYAYGDHVVRVGDWDTATPETSHAPMVDTYEDCVCLVRIQTHDSYRFTGTSRWRQPFISLSSWLASE